ncbi:fungal-specific transcription factor domain-containing protein [Rhexocercosporidium sp. MPI-PUGE-AT-0058]|nr:fungal-specific transcription factor domain-containing protein [Rhexocercosporidium sp. MPI-PUGE-AT-0058]
MCRHKKCDEQQPTCGDCKRLGVLCLPRARVRAPGEVLPGQAPRRGSSLSISLTPSIEFPSSTVLIPITALNSFAGVTTEKLASWSVGEKHLLNHYQQVVSRALVVVDDEHNPFLLALVPMALEHDPVRHSVVALSACHISKVYPSFKRNALKHRSLALDGLKSELNAQRRIEVSLATTLLLALLEICEGNSRKWILHLHGAKALIESHQGRSVEHPLSFLIDLHKFLCCIAAITPTSTLSVLNSAAVPQLDTGSVCSTNLVHPLFGLAREMYSAVNRISQLAARRNNHEGLHSQQDPALDAEARDIELCLQGWNPQRENPDIDGRKSREVSAAASSIRSAATMRLYQVMYGHDVSSGEVQSWVDSILSALSLIRPGSLLENHILFPLFMAGVGSATKANRLTVEYRLNIMETTIGLGNITGAHRVLDTVWQKMNDGQSAVNWEQLMEQDYPGVILL